MLAPMTVLCVTPNVAVDRTLSVPGFAAGGVWRAREVHTAAGGKGLNVARALLRLSRPVLCMGPLGGHTGQQLATLAATEDLPARWTWIKGETRTSVIIVGDDGATTVLNEPGPMFAQGDWDRLVDDIASEAMDCAGICISGSLPPGCPVGGLARLIAAARAQGRPVWVDCSGKALEEAVATAPAGIKVNGDEAGSLLGRPVRDLGEAVGAAREILDQGPEAVGITIGAGGAALVSPAGEWQATPPFIEPINPVGSGDCFLAGLIAGLCEGQGEAEALRLATACGAANALTLRAGDIEATQVRRLASQVIVRESRCVRRHSAVTRKRRDNGC